MEVKKIPNVFESLYRLARNGNYDFVKWRELLTGIHRKSNEKHRIRDVCLLYYSLFKGYSNRDLAEMEIRYKDRGTNRDFGPLTIRDIADTYIPKVSELLKYMNTKQLAMISKFLFMMNRLNEEICNGIISKISSDHLRTTSRSFFNIALALSESGWVNRDSIELLLTQKMDILLNMNRIDLLYLLKTVSLHNIKNEKILDIISDKLEYYLEMMKPEEILSTLHTIYKLNWYHEPVLMNLYFRIQNTLEKFQLKELVLISKCLSHFNLKNLDQFFDLQMTPLVHQILENSLNNNNNNNINNNSNNNNNNIMNNNNINNNNNLDIKQDYLLLFYNYSLKSGSKTFPKLLWDLPDQINQDYKWNMLFAALSKYQNNRNLSPSYLTRRINSHSSENSSNNININNNSNININNNNNNIGNNNNNYSKEHEDLTEFEETDNYINLVLKTLDRFKGFITTNDMDLKYLASITGYMVETGIDRGDILTKIMEKVIKTEKCEVEYLVEILYNLHTVGSEGIQEAFNEVLRRVLEDPSAFEGSNLVPLVTTLLFRNKGLPGELLEIFREMFVSDTPQEEAWQMPSPEEYNSLGGSISRSRTRHTHMRSLDGVSDESLEYLLYTMVFPRFQGLATGVGGRGIDLAGVGSESASGLGSGVLVDPMMTLIAFKDVILSIFKKIKTFKREELLKVFLYYVGHFDQKFQKQLMKSRRLDHGSSSSDEPGINPKIEARINPNIQENIEGNIEVYVEVVPLDRVPEHLEQRYPELESVLIKVDGEMAFKPFYRVPRTRQVLVDPGSRERWDCISRNVSRTLLHLNNYDTLEI